jgi:hypothetical protein
MTNETPVAAVESTELVNDIQHMITPAKKTAPKKAAKKTAKKAAPAAKKSPKKADKKVPAKKAAKASPAPKAKAEKKEPKANGKASGGLGKPRTAILETLSKYQDGLTRNQISEKTGINSGFTSLLGHIEADKREDNSLAKEGYIKIQVQDIDGKNVTLYVITAKGRKSVGK